MEAAASPLPRDETTPPVMKINLVFMFAPSQTRHANQMVNFTLQRLA
jgi:hypothetical protein